MALIDIGFDPVIHARIGTEQSSLCCGSADGRYDVSDFVNLNNGNFHLEIPLAQVQERNGVTETTNLVYDNSFYLIGTRSGPPVQEYWTTLGQSGAAFTGNLRIEVSPNYVRSIPVTNTGINYQCGNNTIPQYTNWQFTDIHGTIHPFPPGLMTERAGLSGCPDTPNGQASATDGSGYWISLANYTNYVVYDTHGNQVANNLSNNIGVVDNNGNHPPYGQGFKDLLGRSTTPLPGYTPTYKTINVYTNFGVSSITELGPVSGLVLSSLTLPDGRTYSFQYDEAGSPAQPGHYGSLTGITLPTGAQINITSQVFAYLTSARLFGISRIATPDGSWNFSYTQVGTGSTAYVMVTATAPPDPHTGLASQTTDSLPTGAIGHVVKIYAGTATGTPLRTITTLARIIRESEEI